MVADCAGSTTFFVKERATSGRRRIEAGVLILDPALLIPRILDRQRLLGNMKRTERIHHHGQLVRALGADRRLGATRMRPMWNAVRMVRDAPEFDALPAH